MTTEVDLLRADLASASQELRHIRAALAHHLAADTDPCQDRGVEWPCDVAEALSARNAEPTHDVH